MPIDFPASPSVGQQYIYAGVTYTYTARGVWSAASFAPLDSPAFIGNPTAPTAGQGDNDTSIATTAFVQTAMGSGGQAVDFRAWKNNVAQAIPGSAYTKLTFSTEVFDRGSYYDPALSRWTPPAGYVHISVAVFVNGLVAGGQNYLGITKNGAAAAFHVAGMLAASTSDGLSLGVDDICNGTDYYEVILFTSGTGPSVDGGTPTFFCGHVISAQGPQGVQGPAGPSVGSLAGSGGSGRLNYVSPTSLQFVPFNGDKITINGSIYSIPAGSIVGLANTATYVNGVAGQNLAANTLYYVYVFSNAGVLTADFSITGHSTSTAAGNVGVEIKTGDPTRTLIGMARTNPSSQFLYDAANKMVLSWFNRRNVSLVGASTAGAGTTSGAAIELNNNARINLCTWGDEAVFAGMTGFGACSALATIAAGLLVDQASGGAITVSPSQATIPTGTYIATMASAGAYLFSEGFHFLTPYGQTPGGTATYGLVASAMVRG